jgi:hypothetical protein
MEKDYHLEDQEVRDSYKNKFRQKEKLREKRRNTENV